MVNRLLIFVFASVMLSCASTKKQLNTPNTVQSSSSNQSQKYEKSVFPKLQATYHESRPKDFELIHTRLDLEFDWENALMHGTATITCSPKIYPQNTLVLDAKGMIIHSVYFGNQLFKHQYNQDKLTIYLDKTYLKSDTLTLSVKYTAQPDARPLGGSQAIAGDKGLYFINPKGEDPTKMPQIWTQGETESNSVWFPTIDAPNQKMTQDLFITVDKKYTTLSNGILVKSTFKENNLRTDHWQQTLPHAPYLTMMSIGEFAVQQDRWKKANGKEIPVHYYVEKEWEEEAKHLFKNTPEMLTFFSEITGFEYPWDKYHQIVVRDYVSGAMENTGAVIFGDFVYSTEQDLLDKNWDDIIAHELSHHWFGDLVTCESWSNLPLNESFATYFEVLWDEYKLGKSQGDYHLQSDKETYFRSSTVSGHHDLIWFDYYDKENMFDGHSYSKGACVLSMLRGHLGDDAFFEGIKHYLHQHQYSTVEAHDLRLAFEYITGLDLNWFFNQWFFAKGHPILEVTHRKEKDSLFVSVSQKQDLDEFPLYKIPSSIRIWSDSVFQDYPINIQLESEEFAFLLPDTLSNFIIDPNNQLLVVWKHEKPKSFLEHQYKHSEHYYWRKMSLKALGKTINKHAAETILLALKDPFFDVRLEAIGESNRIKKTHSAQLYTALNKLVFEDEHPEVRGSALQALFDFFSSEKDLSTTINHVLINDLSNVCKIRALFLLSKLDENAALNHAYTMLNDKSNNVLVGLAYFFMSYGSEAHFGLFEKLVGNKYLTDRSRKEVKEFFAYFVRELSNDYKFKAHETLNKYSKSGDSQTNSGVFMIILDSLYRELAGIDEAIIEYEKAKDFAWSQKLKNEKQVVQELIKLYEN